MISFMATAAGAIYAAFVAFCPVEYVVDCASWPGKAPVKIEYWYETVNGERGHGGAQCGIGTRPWLMVFMLTEGLEKRGWQIERLHDPEDPMAFVITGTTRSRIKSVTITGDTWEPVVERRFVPPKK